MTPPEPDQKRKHHRIFATVWAPLARLLEKGPIGENRQRLLAGLSGNVLEIGAGSGSNLSHYPGSVRLVVATEPDRFMIPNLIKAVPDAGTRVEIVQSAAERLPFASDSFDHAVVTLVLCSVDDPGAVVDELARVVKPGGSLVVLEHVRAPEGSRLSRIQDMVAPAWRFLGGGCNPNRDTKAVLEAGGFETSGIEMFDLEGTLPIVKPHIRGEAVRPR